MLRWVAFAVVFVSFVCTRTDLAVAQYYSGGSRLGDIIRAQGEYENYHQEARKKDLDNRLHATHTYFQMRAANRAYREAERGPRITQEQANKLAQQSLPPRSNAQQLDPVTGAVHWPEMLRQPVYKAGRRQLDQLFRQRAAIGGGVGTMNYEQIKVACGQMEDTLRSNVRNMSSGSYTLCRNFLECLLYEARFPAA
jgi:hypothetical protein